MSTYTGRRRRRSLRPTCELLRALTSEANRRSVQLPPAFDVPDRTLWEPGYSAQARRTLLPVPRTLGHALAIVRPCLDPLLDHTASGRWEPAKRLWQPK